MKKSMLCAGLVTVLCANGYADETNAIYSPNNSKVPEQIASVNAPISPEEIKAPAPQGIATPTPAEIPANKTPATPNTTTAADATAPATSTTAPAANTTTPAANTTTPAASTTTPATSTTTTTPSTSKPATSTSTTTPSTSKPATSTTTPAAIPENINCTYRIPAEVSKIDPKLVMKWAEKAAEQSFDLDYDAVDQKLVNLKPCFTEQGWQGFNDALQKSGNLEAIKSQQLTVSSMVNGQATVMEIKDNQWKVSLPMQVVYQNDKEKLTQPLTINLVVGRKISGDLGIIQMIAVPSQSSTPTGNKTAPQPTEEKQPNLSF